MTETELRLRRLVERYAEQVWPTLPRPDPTADDLLSIEVRADGYANAHVEGEHGANGICRFRDARACGEWAAAAEFVECGS